jgi:hypothetical protein
MTFEELIEDDPDEFVDDVDWDDDTLITLDEEMAAQEGDEIGLDFGPDKGALGDYWSVDTVV